MGESEVCCSYSHNCHKLREFLQLIFHRKSSDWAAFFNKVMHIFSHWASKKRLSWKKKQTLEALQLVNIFKFMSTVCSLFIRKVLFMLREVEKVTISWLVHFSRRKKSCYFSARSFIMGAVLLVVSELSLCRIQRGYSCINAHLVCLHLSRSAGLGEITQSMK